MSGDYFFTVDAETVCIPRGVEILDRIRAEAKQEMGEHIPIIWFVRYQDGWSDEVSRDHPTPVRKRKEEPFDGLALCREKFLQLQDRGDEIGWHYHAYHYVHRNDLDHDTRVEILTADLERFGTELKRRYPEFAIESFQFGWFFVPDYGLYSTLRKVGIKTDASRNDDGENVLGFEATYLEPPMDLPCDHAGVRLFPRDQDRILLFHDWGVVPHQFGWHDANAAQAARKRHEAARVLRQSIKRARSEGSAFTTYRAASDSMAQGAA